MHTSFQRFESLSLQLGSPTLSFLLLTLERIVFYGTSSYMFTPTIPHQSLNAESMSLCVRNECSSLEINSLTSRKTSELERKLEGIALTSNLSKVCLNGFQYVDNNNNKNSIHDDDNDDNFNNNDNNNNNMNDRRIRAMI